VHGCQANAIDFQRYRLKQNKRAMRILFLPGKNLNQEKYEEVKKIYKFSC
jgi:hypothetical protein